VRRGVVAYHDAKHEKLRTREYWRRRHDCSPGTSFICGPKTRNGKKCRQWAMPVLPQS